MTLCNFGHFTLLAKSLKNVEVRALKLDELTGSDE